MNLDRATFSQAMSLIGSIIIAIAALKFFFGVNVNIGNGSAVELGAMGFLIKNISF